MYFGGLKNKNDSVSVHTLHGYLLIGQKNFIGKITFRKRYFAFSENACKLFYFKLKEDIEPLGEIDIRSASFAFESNQSIDIPFGDGPARPIFNIISGDTTYILEAPEGRNQMMMWLEELQHKRYDFCVKNSISVENENSSLNLRSFYHTKDQAGAAECEYFNDEEASDMPIKKITALEPMKSHIQTPFEQIGPPPLRSPKTASTSNIRSSMPVRGDGVKKRTPSTLGRFFNAVVGGDGQGEAATEFVCERCVEIGAVLAQRDDELNSAQQELEARTEINKVLHRNMQILQREQTTNEQLLKSFGADPSVSTATSTILNLLRERDKRVVELEHIVNEFHLEKESRKTDFIRLQAQVKASEEQLMMLKGVISEKDKTIISLTNKVHVIETSVDKDESFHVVDFTKESKSSEHLENLEAENSILEKEIRQMNKLLLEAHNREKAIFLKCSQYEARYYQIHSKYLFMLSELDKPQREVVCVEKGDRRGASVPAEAWPQREDLVSRLLHEAITTEMPPHLHGNSEPLSEYDQYGFTGPLPMPQPVKSPGARAKASQAGGKVTDGGGGGGAVGAVSTGGASVVDTAVMLQNKARQIHESIKNPIDISVAVKWENLMASQKELTRSNELKVLVRQGCPLKYRGRLWKACIDWHIADKQRKLGPGYYDGLVSRSARTQSQNPAVKQIELDLLRTLPNNRYYASMQSEGIPRLRKILMAFSMHNPTVGYCQGLNRLVAIALLFLDEEDAFWCLVAIVDHIMPPDYYSKTLLAAQADQKVLKDLVAEKLPRLAAHLEARNVDISLFTFQWFLTVFVDNIPVQTYLTIWDAFLYEGSKILFRYALAALKLHENDVLALNDYYTIYKYCCRLAETLTDVKELSRIAFHDFNPFRMKNIIAKRAQYVIQVQHELEELDAMREDFNKIPSSTSVDKHDCSWTDDEDEEAVIVSSSASFSSKTFSEQ